MADVKISALPSVTTPASTDIFPVAQGGTTKGETRAQIHALESGEHLVLPQVDEAATPTLVLDGGTSGFFGGAVDEIGVAIAGVERFLWTGGLYRGKITAGPALFDRAATATTPTLLPASNDSNTGMGLVSADVGALIAGGVNVMQFGEAAAAPLMGFFGTAAIAKPSGIAVTAAGIHAALVSLGLIAA